MRPVGRSSTASRGRAARRKRSIARSVTRGARVDRALLIDVAADELVRRLTSRWVCESAGHLYNLLSNPPRVAGRCDLDDLPLVQRADDRPETVRARLEQQLGALEDVVDFYRSAGLLRTVDGLQPIPDVTAALLADLPGQQVSELMVTRKSRREIEKMRQAGRIVAEVLALVESELKPGVSTAHLDRLAERHIRAAGAVPSFKGYGHRSNPFPASLCISIDDEVVHGIPGERVIRDGPDRVGRRRRDLRRLAWRRRADVRRRRAAVGGHRARRDDAPRDDGRHRRRRSRRTPRRDLGRDRGRRRAPRLRHRPPVRRPRDRHRDAPGAAGPELPHRRPRPEAGARDLPRDRADADARRPRGRGQARRLDRRDDSTARSPPTSNTRLPSPRTARRS